MLVLIALCLFNCGNDVTPLDNTVHLAGVLGVPDRDIYATYWKDGVVKDLSKNKVTSKATSMYVDGTTALIGGYKRPGSALPSAIMWENDTETTISGSFGDPTLIASRDVTVYRVSDPVKPRMVINRNGVLTNVEDTSFNYGVTAVTMT